MKNLIEELRWRGLIHDMAPDVEKQFESESIAYIGFDPTADSLHVGSLVQIMLLKHLQRFGHKPIALIGDATAMIGDPSGKSKERNLMSASDISVNTQKISKQLQNLIPDVETRFNLVWMHSFSFLDFIRDIGKNITVNYMKSKQSVKNRIDEGDGMSFTEFTYQLIQGYDFLRLFEDDSCSVQMGGSDQWGNMTTGIDLIKKMNGGDAHAVTTPLLKKADGKKFGKTEEGNVWLDPEKTSPFNFFQFWLKTQDSDVSNFMRIFTFKTKEEIEELESKHKENPDSNLMQKELAKEVTRIVHGDSGVEDALRVSSILFGKSSINDLKSIKEDSFISALSGVENFNISEEQFNNSENIVELLFNSGIFESKSFIRRLIKNQGLKINKTRIQSESDDFELIHDKFLLVQKGKREYYLIIVDNV
jgi:tyrosyl-tRNA synthetase